MRTTISILLRFTMISLVPIGLFFYRDFDYSRHVEMYCVFAFIFIVAIFSALITVIQGIANVLKSDRKHAISIFVPIIILITSIMFRTELLILKEIVKFKIYNEDFSRVVNVASTCSGYCDIPDDITWADSRQMVIYKTLPNQLQYVLIPSRSNTNIVFFSDEEYVKEWFCFYQLDTHWYVCNSWKWGN